MMNSAFDALSLNLRSPFSRGFDDGLAGKPGPAFPNGNSDWASRLYNRGWESGTQKRMNDQSSNK